jgi:hypothetical protein
MSTTPFRLDPKPLRGATSPFAGDLAVSRAYRSLGIPRLIEEHLDLRKRRRGFSEAQMIESIVLLQTIGGDCPEDIKVISCDECLAHGLGYSLPKATAVRDFLELFHNRKLEDLRPAREVQRSFIMPSSAPLQAFQKVQSETVQRISDPYSLHEQAQTIATIDQDATIIESYTSLPVGPGNGLSVAGINRWWPSGRKRIWWWPMSFATVTFPPARNR